MLARHALPYWYNVEKSVLHEKIHNFWYDYVIALRLTLLLMNVKGIVHVKIIAVIFLQSSVIAY